MNYYFVQTVKNKKILEEKKKYQCFRTFFCFLNLDFILLDDDKFETLRGYIPIIRTGGEEGI